MFPEDIFYKLYILYNYIKKNIMYITLKYHFLNIYIYQKLNIYYSTYIYIFCYNLKYLIKNNINQKLLDINNL